VAAKHPLDGFSDFLTIGEKCFLAIGGSMLAKVTSKNQLTLPKAILQQIGEVEYFAVQADEGKIVLTPMRVHPADKVRDKLQELGITENDIADAISFARQR
jgi:bifunctional DNA-binding transcriptional regulator/antitoxin component of YhaV-PrlF toxin-antitoxin module